MVYHDLAAVAVRVRHRRWRPGNFSRAVMVSVHVDTIHVSSGGSDNGASVGIAVELIRSLVAHGASDPLALRDGAAVVIFSSAEEEGFMGAHGVVTSHPWYNEVRCVLNLEAMGNGGPHRMFQATSGRASAELLAMWSQAAPKPQGSVLLADIFASGIIKSNTDHRIFRDVGDTPGFDFAFVENTHLYHTPGDLLSAVRPGSLQTSGDNLLAFMKAYAKAPPLESGGDVSLTQPQYQSRPNVSRRKPLTWFAPPGASTYIMYDVLDPEISRALFVAGVALLLQVASGTYMANAADPRDLVRVMLAGPLAGFGAAAAVAAGPAGAALAAVGVAAAAGTSAPWVSDPYLFAALTLVPGLLASLGAFKLLHVLLRAVKGPVAVRMAAGVESADKVEGRGAEGAKSEGAKGKGAKGKGASTPGKKKGKTKSAEDVDTAAGKAAVAAAPAESVGRTAAAYVTADEAADWNILAGNVALLTFIAAYAISISLASSYLFLLPAVMLSGMLMLVPVVRSFFRPKQGLGSFPVATSIASAAIVPLYAAFPMQVGLSELLFGMTGRSAITGDASGPFGEYTYDAVCGAQVGIAVLLVGVMLPTLLRPPIFGSIVKVLAAVWTLAFAAAVLTCVPRTGSPWSRAHPQQLVISTVVPASGRAAVMIHAAGPGTLVAVAAAVRAGLSASGELPGVQVDCDLEGSENALDLATYASRGACLVTAPGLEGDLRTTEAAASAAEEEAAVAAARRQWDRGEGSQAPRAPVPRTLG